MTKFTWQVAAVTDPGLKRKENQDNYFLSDDNRVMVVADGMGGMRGGSLASQIAVDAVKELWTSDKPDESEPQKVQQWLFEAVSKANELVFKAAAEDPAVKDMGTTIVAAIHSDDGNLQIAHVGDSRAYLVREGKTIVLTQDHSVVMEMLLQGKMTEEQLRTSPFRHYLTRCVGHKHKVEIDKTPAQIKAGDWLVMSSDGLSTVVDDEEIAGIVGTCDTPQEACDDLLNEILARGAPDNVTIVCVAYTETKSDVKTPKTSKGGKVKN